MKFILSDESVNCYGFRVLNSGARLEQFRKNPVMLYMHNRQMMPIGKWKDIELENGQLTAVPEFDEDDELAMKVKAKVESGNLRAASIGFDVISYSEDPDLMLAGQTRPTVTSWEPYEASIVDIPGNKNALKLSNFKKGITLSGDSLDVDIDKILPETKEQKMESVALALGLDKEASEKDVLAAITKLQKDAESKTPEQLQADLLKLGRAKGLINDDNEEHFTELAESNFDALLSIVQNHKLAAAGGEGGEAEQKEKPAKKDFSMETLITELRKNNGSSQSEDKIDSFDALQKKGSAYVLNFRKENEAEFVRLYKEKYGVEPVLD